MVHDVEHRFFHDGAESSCARGALIRPLHDRLERAFLEFQLDAFHPEELLILLHDRIFRLRQYIQQRLLFQRMQCCDDREPSDKLGDEAEPQEIVGLHEREVLLLRIVLLAADVRPESDGILVHPVRDDFFQSFERPPANK